MWTADKLRTARLTRANVEYDGSSLAKALGVSSASVYRALQEPAAQMPLGDLSLQQRGSHVPPAMDLWAACRPSRRQASQGFFLSFRSGAALTFDDRQDGATAWVLLDEDSHPHIDG